MGGQNGSCSAKFGSVSWVHAGLKEIGNHPWIPLAGSVPRFESASILAAAIEPPTRPGIFAPTVHLANSSPPATHAQERSQGKHEEDDP